MFRFRSFNRVVVAATLILSGATLATAASTVPAGATGTALTFDCGTGFAISSTGNGGTVTVTVGTSCTGFNLNGLNGVPPAGSATLNGSYVPTMQQIPVAPGDVIVYTAPVSGSGRDALSFQAGQNPGDGLTISFPVPTGSLTDNGDGTMTVTYTGAIVGFMLPSGSVCAEVMPAMPPADTEFIFTPQGPAGASLAASPAIISVGTVVLTMTSPDPTPLTAGAYQTCMYQALSGPGGMLLSSLAISIGQVTPTTVPTTVPTTDPVTPTFTG